MMPRRITHTVGQTAVTFTLLSHGKGLLGLTGSDEPVPFEDWVQKDDVGLGLAIAALQAYEDRHPGHAISRESDFLVSHGAIASLSEASAKALGLPAAVPFVLQVRTTGSMAHDGFSIRDRWLDGNAPVASERTGSIIRTTQGSFRIPEPAYSIVSEIEQFNAASETDASDRWNVIASIKALLDGGTDAGDPLQQPSFADSGVELEAFIRNITIYPAAALSLRLFRRDDGSVDFDPILFSEDTGGNDDGSRSISEADGILSNELLDEFLTNRATGFRMFDNAKGTYLLKSGHYLTIDPQLLTALKIVRNKQKEGPGERLSFAENPAKAFADTFNPERSNDATDDGMRAADADEEAETAAARLYVETIEYSERVVGLGVWRPPVLPYVEKPKNPWEPETFGIRIGGEYLPLTLEDVPALQEELAMAIDRGEPSVMFKGVTVPANEETRTVVDQLTGMLKPKDEPATTRQKEPAKELYSLQVKENFDAESFAPDYQPRPELPPFIVPKTVSTPLLSHQLAGFEWACDCYSRGYPGILNADDQGLGKTLQAIAFLSWLQSHLKTRKAHEQKPVLIVAPTSLLRNWIQEVKRHTIGEGLGVRTEVFGSGLRTLRRSGTSGKDIDDASEDAKLELDFLRAGDDASRTGWVLTTYTTLMNYQQSFARIPFLAVVFDEIQAIKNPASMRHRAVQAVQAEFRIGLTGTPIENALSDLWAIMDTLVPGRLGALKEFSRRYQRADLPRLKELHSRIFASDGPLPAYGLRRMKSETIEGLPRKSYRLYPEFMPDPQAMAYDVIFQQLKDAAKGRALKILHYLRSVSLHPDRIELVEPEGFDAYVERSARLKKAIEVLDEIRSAEERALVFIESIDMQHAFRQLLKARYGLSDVKIINGSTAPDRRMKLVNAFQASGQAGAGFEVMILGPRAAGVGLTLTAATHVIHLSRWWNPAVEEQCNDRIYRIGQDRDVTIHIPTAIHGGHKDRSFDCILNNIMQAKRRLSSDTLIPPIDDDGGIRQFLNGLYGEEEEILTEIDAGGWLAFEEWIIKRMQESGNWTASRTPWSGDKGADGVFIHKDRDQSVIVQAKYTQNTTREIDESAIQQVLYARDKYEVRFPSLVVLTNASRFAPRAEKLAQQNDVILVDRARLCLWPDHILT